MYTCIWISERACNICIGMGEGNCIWFYRYPILKYTSAMGHN